MAHNILFANVFKKKSKNTITSEFFKFFFYSCLRCLLFRTNLNKPISTKIIAISVVYIIYIIYLYKVIKNNDYGSKANNNGMEIGF